MTMIADRPVEVDDRVQVGHWEGDCIMGSGNRSAIGTLVERTTRFQILVHLPTGRAAAENMRGGIAAALVGCRLTFRRTLTWDQGKADGAASTDHDQHRHTGVPLRRTLTVAAGLQREHERLAARLLPKGTDLSHSSSEELQRVADELNDRPARLLGGPDPPP